MHHFIAYRDKEGKAVFQVAYNYSSVLYISSDFFMMCLRCGTLTSKKMWVLQNYEISANKVGTHGLCVR